MAFVIADRVRESSTTTGTGSIALGGAVTGYQTFDTVLDTGDTTYYTIADQGGANWEVGIGTFTSPSTLARTTILSSSNGGSIVTFTAGTKDVFISLPASKTNTNDQPNVIAVNSTSNALRITQTGTGNALVVEDSANPDATPTVITKDGDVIVGGTAAIASYQYFNPQLFVLGGSVGGQKGGQFTVVFSNDTTGPSVELGKSRSATVGTVGTIVQSGDQLGIISFNGDDGTDLRTPGATIQALVDGTPGLNDMPGRLVFSTTADGASSPTERMRIDSTGAVGIGSSALTGYGLRVTRSLTGATTARSVLSQPTFQSDVTGGGYSYESIATTAAATFTLGNLSHFIANQGTFGLGSVVTNQFGFNAQSSLTSATNNYGFYSNIASGTGRWNFYANGTADNYFNGNVGVGTTTLGSKLTVNGDVAGTFFVNPTTVSANYTVPTNYNAMTAGPITVNSGVTVTVPSGSTWVVT